MNAFWLKKRKIRRERSEATGSPLQASQARPRERPRHGEAPRGQARRAAPANAGPGVSPESRTPDSVVEHRPRATAAHESAEKADDPVAGRAKIHGVCGGWHGGMVWVARGPVAGRAFGGRVNK